MVADARSLLPTDLLALVAHGSTSSYANHAWPRERLGTQETQPTLSVLRDQLLSFSRQRYAFVSVRRQKLQGLVGARRRGGRQAWELDYLVDCGADEVVLVDLLTRVVRSAGAAGAEKLFLRLERASPLFSLAREVGFQAYQEEVLYARDGLPPGEAAACRPATLADNYPLFRLYTASTPEPARRHEAPTYAEWQAGMERRWLRNGAQLVYEREGVIRAEVRAARLSQGLMFDFALAPEFAAETLGLLIAAAHALPAGGSSNAFALLPSGNEASGRQLEEAGFSVAGEYVSLVHRTTRPLTLPRAVPAVAKNAIGA